MNSTLIKSAWIILLFCLLFAGGVTVRRAVLNAQYSQYGKPLPFNLESALNFRHVRLLAETGRIPALDRYIQYPQGVIVNQTYETGLEYICALFAKFFPTGVPLDERVRWISVLWFCLGIPALFLWVWRLTGSISGAACGAAFYAFSLAAVIRSTGQEIGRESFSIPLLIFYLALNAGLAEGENPSAAGQMPARKFVFLSVLSAAFLAAAVMLWDLMQFYVMLWAALGCCRVIRGEYFNLRRRQVRWYMAFAALVLAGFLNPYLRTHGFLYSPAMLLAYGMVLTIPVSMPGKGRARLPWLGGAFRLSPRRSRLAEPSVISMFLRLCLVLLPLGLGLCFLHKYAATYGHFAELLWAKIIFLNAKPADPALLTFAQRILWVPALNSANISLTITIFPVMLVLFLFAVVVFICNPHWRTNPELTELLLFGFVSLAAFVLFVRLHVFTAVAFAAACGLLGAWSVQRKNIFVRVLLILILLGGISAEAENVLRDPLRWGARQDYLAERKQLVEWLRLDAAGQPVLANFGISAFVLAYAECPIILHPKFESPEIRKRVQEYGEKLFKSDESEFRAWAGQYGAVFYVYSRGEFADVSPACQMRYFVNALHPPPDAAARLFEFNPSAARWFRLIWQNDKYRVFRMISASDEKTAGKFADEALVKMKTGRAGEARLAARHALLYDPENTNALNVLRKTKTGMVQNPRFSDNR